MLSLATVTITSTLIGNTNGVNKIMFASGNGGTITGVTPVSGPRVGGNIVTINGNFIGSGSDITSVTFCGIPATILAQSQHHVKVMTGGTTTAICTLVVQSTCVGTTTFPFAYRYNPCTYFLPSLFSLLLIWRFLSAVY